MIMLQMLAPTSDIVFLNISPQAPVEIANSVMMHPIARTHRRRTTIAFDASPRQPQLEGRGDDGRGVDHRFGVLCASVAPFTSPTAGTTIVADFSGLFRRRFVDNS